MLRTKLSVRHICLFVVVGLACAANGSAQTTTRWLQQFGSSGSDQARAVAVKSFVYLAGVTTGTLPSQSTAGQDDAFLRKYDLAGGALWTRQFGTPGVETGDAIGADASGIYVAGSTTGTFAGQTSAGGQDGYLRKYDTNGNVVWTRQFGGTDVDTAFGVTVNPSGVLVAGSTVAAGGATQAILRKFDSGGNLLWTRSFGAGSTTTIQAASSDDSGFYVAGRSTGVLPGQTAAGAFVRRYDVDGNEQWTSQFEGANTVINGVAALPDAVYVAGTINGTLPGQSSFGFVDAFVRKYDTSGIEQWTRQFGTSSTDDAFAVAADPTGAYVGGQTNGQLNGANSIGGSDTFVRKYDTNGNERWTQQLGSVTTDAARAIGADSYGVYVAGFTSGTIAGQSGAGGPDDAIAAQLDLGGPPYVPINGVVNAASYTQAVVAGSIASAFGLSLMPQDAGSLGVKVGGISAPVFADTPAQINFQVPWEMAGQNPIFLVVSGDGNSTSPVSVPITTYAPALFSTDGSGSGQGAILIANTAIVAAPVGTFPGSRPASRGEFISIYATGLGPVSNRPATGAMASANSLTLATATVTIGGISTPASFSGLAPGFVGLYQLNVQVPGGASPGSAVPVTVSIAGSGSNTVTIAVQ